MSPTGEARQMRVSALSGGLTVDSLSYNDLTVHNGKQQLREKMPSLLLMDLASLEILI